MEFTHIANPVRVQALVITDATSVNDDAYTQIVLGDGTVRIIGPEMTSRHKPSVGDYLVMQEDGYIYVNPKDVFERKYRVIDSGPADEAKVKVGHQNNIEDNELRLRAMDYASRHYEAGSNQVVRAAEAYFDFLKGAAA